MTAPPDGMLAWMTDQSQPVIRRGRPEDHDAVVALDIRSFEPHTSPGQPITAANNFFERVPAEQHFMAWLDGHLVGYIRMGHPTSLPSNAHVVEIQGLAVDPAARGRGVGAMLVRAVLDDAEQRGMRKVSLRVMGGNPTAQRLYQRMGFEVQGHLRDEFLINGEYVDDLMMARFV